MNDISKIIITVLMTSFMSFIAFMLSKLYFYPIEKYRKLKAKTSFCLIYYANIYNNPIDIAEYNDKMPDDYINAQNELRKLASEWNSFIYYKSFPSFFVLSNKKINKLTSLLIGLSNSFQLPYNTKDGLSHDLLKNTVKYINEIKEILKLKS